MDDTREAPEGAQTSLGEELGASAAQRPGAIEFFVTGEPKSKGSKNAFVVKGRAIITEGKQSKLWERTVKAALSTMNLTTLHGPVEVEMVFYLPRPASHAPAPKSKDIWKRHPVPQQKPDIDKLTRAVFDAMTKIVYEDDARVISLVVKKRYAETSPGVQIRVTPATPEGE